MNDALYELIQSLNRTEKAYFKKYGLGFEEKKYAKVFDAISKLSDGSTKAVNDTITKRVTVKNASSVKWYLSNRLTTSIAEYHAGKSADRKLNQQLEKVHALSIKGLHKHALKVAKKAKEDAMQMGNFRMAGALIHELKGIHYRIYEKDIDRKIGKLGEEEDYVFQQLDLSNQLSILYWKIYSKQNLSASVKDRESIIDKKETAMVDEALSTSHGVIRQKANRIQYLVAISSGDFEKAKAGAIQVIRIWTELSDHIRYNVAQYITDLRAVLIAQYYSRSYDEMGIYIQILKGVSARGVEEEVLAKNTAYQFELVGILQSERFEEGKELIPEVLKYIEDSSRYLNAMDLAAYYFQIAMIHFYSDGIGESLKYINKVLNEFGHGLSFEGQYHAMIFELFCLHDLEEQEVLWSRIKSVQRVLKQHECYKSYDRHFLQLLKDSSSVISGKQRAQLFDKFIAEVEEGDPQIKADSHLASLTLLSWLNKHRSKQMAG